MILGAAALAGLGVPLAEGLVDADLGSWAEQVGEDWVFLALLVALPGWRARCWEPSVTAPGRPPDPVGAGLGWLP